MEHGPSPTAECRKALCIWSPLLTGTAALSFPGSFLTPWIQRFALKPSPEPLKKLSRRSSIPTREASSPARLSSLPLKERNIRISMDGRGRALDNIFIERFWRSFKYEWLYLNDLRICPGSFPGPPGIFPVLQHRKASCLPWGIEPRRKKVYLENRSPMAV